MLTSFHRQKALDKIEAMNKRVGYPNELLDENKIEEFYTEVNYRIFCLFIPVSNNKTDKLPDRMQISI